MGCHYCKLSADPRDGKWDVAWLHAFMGLMDLRRTWFLA